jgi:hypothetical protein
MKVSQKGHTVVIKDTEDDFAVFVEKISSQYNSYKAHNIILDITHHSVTLLDLKLFAELSKTHKKNKKSLVIVAVNIDFNKVPSSLQVVPSLLEAQDIIEMEEIERDLGF